MTLLCDCDQDSSMLYSSSFGSLLCWLDDFDVWWLIRLLSGLFYKTRQTIGSFLHLPFFLSKSNFVLIFVVPTIVDYWDSLLSCLKAFFLSLCIIDEFVTTSAWSDILFDYFGLGIDTQHVGILSYYKR
jgi:hypothetical protein